MKKSNLQRLVLNVQQQKNSGLLVKKWESLTP